MLWELCVGCQCVRMRTHTVCVCVYVCVCAPDVLWQLAVLLQHTRLIRRELHDNISLLILVLSQT